MSNYTKKKLGLILLCVGLGIILCGLATLKEEKLTKYMYELLVIGFFPTVVGIVLLITIPSKNSIIKNGNKGYCEIIKIESSHSANGKGVRTSFYFLVEFKATDGTIRKEGIKCNLDDMNKYKAGTKLACYIKGKNIHVPRPFEVINE